MAKKYNEEIQRLLKTVIQHFDDEDQSVRQRQIRKWRHLKLLWENVSSAYYNEVAHDWRIPSNQENNDQANYDKPINVFRAYLESIIAALSVTVPAIKCFPEDADNSLDLLTARAGDKIGKKIYHQNDVSLLWVHALFVYMTEGMVASYNYSKSDKSYGQYEENKYEDNTEEHEQVTCPECGFEVEDNIVEPDTPVGLIEGQDICPSCSSLVNLQIQRSFLTISRLIKKEFKNKSRQKIEVCGGLNVRVPVYAKKQEDCPYLGYDYETHYVNIIKDYGKNNNDLKEKFQGKSQGVYDPYEAWGRLSPQYMGEYPINNVTCRNRWFRPCAFDVLNDEDATKLHKEFPEGVKVVLANDDFAYAIPESLDDHWTLTYNPLSDHLHHDPLGLLLVSIQEITNDLISLIIQTIEHGIGQTFVDPQVVNLNAYRQMEVIPGGLYPAKSKSGKALGDGFHEIKTATLSQEVLPFADNIQQLGQLISGALPSLFGGALQEQKTASGYAMSRAQALQRLQNVWKIFTIWWKQTFTKVIPQYIESIHEDEKDVELDMNGNFINVFIRKAELEGKIGKIELEANENLPITWSQRKDTIFQLLQSNNEQILSVLGSPENLPIIREALGLDDFYVPGEDDRNKQYEEIKLLLDSVPILLPPSIDPMLASQNPVLAQDPNIMMQMQPQEVPSVEIDPDIDNHALEFEICRSWLVSDAGRLAKTENSEGYRNVLLHAKAHLQIIQQMAAMQQMAEAESAGAAPGKKPKETEKEAPISGEGEVNATA